MVPAGEGPPSTTHENGDISLQLSEKDSVPIVTVLLGSGA